MSKLVDICSPTLLHSFNLTINSVKARAFPKPGDLLGAGRHFQLCPAQSTRAELLSDGYYDPAREFKVNRNFNSFKRMWKGGIIKFHQNGLRVGDKVTQELSLKDMTERQTSRGSGIFMTENRRFLNDQGLSVEEDRVLVYLSDNHSSTKILKKQAIPDYSETLIPDDVMLFRFSAVTFNAHLIHYCQSYAKSEGYDKVLVHGPLTVSLLLDRLENLIKDGQRISEFDYQCTGPCFVNDPLTLNYKFEGSSCQVWATNHNQSLILKGTATIASSK